MTTFAEGRVIEIAIEETRWVLLSHAVQSRGFAATDAVQIAQNAGLRLQPKNARNHAETLEDWDLLERLPEPPVFFIPTDLGDHVHSCVTEAIGAVPPRPEALTRIIAVVAQANARDYQLLTAGPAGAVDLADELRRRVLEAPWSRRGSIRVGRSRAGS